MTKKFFALMRFDMVTDILNKQEKFVIYGAQVIAYGAYVAIEHLTGRRPECFAVGMTKGKPGYPLGNPNEIDGIPVKLIEEVPKNVFIVVGVTELIQKEVIPYLNENRYENYYPLTQHEEHLLMSAYYDKLGKFPVVNQAYENLNLDFTMYEVCNHRDKPLAGHPMLFEWEKAIQAGSALTDERIASLNDNNGINISSKNKQYCEMTVAYWMWKNTKHDWIGLEHYRRHLLVRPEYLSDDIDAILPLPYICYPNEMSQFLRFVSEDVLKALLKALKDIHPDEYDDYYEILYGKYQYTYNLVCAKKSVYDDYCNWFFEITEYMEDMSETVSEIKDTRALSYVAEVLTNLYFMSHQNDLKILHVEKEIYI